MEIEVEVEDGKCYPLALHLVRSCSHAELRDLAAKYGNTKYTATMRKHELAEIVAPKLQCTRSS